MKAGFTLVELLIVIALIAILSVAILATINPVEKSNLARDASIKNDAAEVLNAYQRYNVERNTFPWMDVDGGLTIPSADSAWFGRSDDNGAGLCSLAATTSPDEGCEYYDRYPGLLIVTDELKKSFLDKGYTSVNPDEPYYSLSDLNFLWIDKKYVTAAQLDAIYVCFMPRAKVNRTKNLTLRKPVVNYFPPGHTKTKKKAKKHGHSGIISEVVGLEYVSESDFVGNLPHPKWDFKTPETSLFKCVP